MNEKQEAEWLCAKGLELAILIKGPSRKKVSVDSVDKIIEDEYEAIAGKIAGRIFKDAKKMIEKNMI